MKASGSTLGVKIDEKKEKDHHPICNLEKMYDFMILFKPASIKWFKDSHQFSCKIQGDGISFTIYHTLENGDQVVIGVRYVDGIGRQLWVY